MNYGLDGQAVMDGLQAAAAAVGIIVVLVACWRFARR